MSDKLTKIPSKAEDNYVETEVDGERVIMQIDKGFFFTLNDTSEAIWGAIDGKTDMNGIISNVSAQFNVSPDDTSGDIIELLDKLVENKLVELA